jgi:ABC-type glycerol-3-phosphate transport system substrate-binding protein
MSSIGPTRTRRDALRMLGIGALGALGTTAAAGGLTACAPSPGSGTAGGDAASKDFTFTSWSLNEEPSKSVTQKIVDAWAKKENSKIRTPSYPFNEYLSQLVLKLRGGETTGAIQLDIAWLGTLAAMGKLVDLGAQAKKGGYTDVALASGQYDGTQYGLPWTTGAIGLIGNGLLLKQAGITKEPVTTEEFEEALRALKHLGGGVVPYAAATKVAQLKDILPWMQTFGCSLLDGGEGGSKGRVTIGDDASVDAVTWYKKLYDAKLIAADVDRFDARALFSQGKAGFYDDAIVAKGVIAAQAKNAGLQDAMQPLMRPVLQAGDTPQALLWGHLIVVARGEGSDTAADFALHTTSDRATVVGYFEDLALPPTTTAALADPKVTADAFTTDWTERITKTATGNPFWRYAKAAQIDEAIAKQVQSVLIGKASAKQAMRTAGEEVTAMIKD